MRKLQQVTYYPNSLLYKFHAIWISIAISTKMTSCIILFQQKQFSLVKSVKQQISYFPYFHPSIRTLCKNLHDHKLCIFTLFIFTRYQQLIKVNQEDHVSSMPTIGLIFFLARACQHKTNKIGITILSRFQLKIYNLQDCKHSKSIYLNTFSSP